MEIEVQDVSTPRFADALEFLKDGHSFAFQGVSFYLSPDGFLEVRVQTTWENTTEESALKDFDRAKNVLEYLVRKSTDFAQIVSEHPRRFALVYSDDKGGFLLGHFIDGKLVWCAE